MKKTLLRIITVVSVLSVLLTIVSLPTFAAMAEPAKFNTQNIYLRIDGIEGESKDTKHEKWTDVIYFKHGSENPVQEGSADNVTDNGMFEPIVFKHTVDKGTPKIQEACMKKSFIKYAEVHFCRNISGKQEVVYKVKFEGIRIVKAEVETEELEDGNYRFVETVTFLVNKQTWTETAIGLDNVLGGNTEATFDQTKKASMFDSNTSIILTVACAVIFVLIVVIVILVVGRKKKVAANAPSNDSKES